MYFQDSRSDIHFVKIYGDYTTSNRHKDENNKIVFDSLLTNTGNSEDPITEKNIYGIVD